MNVLSLFDGMSCGQIALERANVPVDLYYAAEIDKHAVKVTKANYPNTIHLGDVNNWREWNIDWSNIDLLIGGSPCQDFSQARLAHAEEKIRVTSGLNGNKSGLFYIFLEILKHLKIKNPNVKFMLENVKMKKQAEVELNNFLGVEGVHINSNLVSFQNRPRIYWANWDFPIPKNKNVSFQVFKSSSLQVFKSSKYKRS